MPRGPDVGPPLVWLHGLTGRCVNVIGIAPWLMLQHTLYALDLRGHNLSGRLPGAIVAATMAEMCAPSSKA